MTRSILHFGPRPLHFGLLLLDIPPPAHYLICMMRNGAITFGLILDDLVQQSGMPSRRRPHHECAAADGRICHLCHAERLTYEQEVVMKGEALKQFWHERVPMPLRDLVATPPGRYYRSVSKRKVFHSGPRFTLGLIDPESRDTGGGVSVGACAIEPAAHGAVYAACDRFLRQPGTADFGEQLRYVIVKEASARQIIILSITEFHPTVIHHANALSKSLTRAVGSVSGVFLLEDQSDGRYYLGSGVRDAPRKFRKLYGASDLSLTVAGRRFLFPALVFSQVNVAAAEHVINYAAAYLGPKRDDLLLDLYCGYGLFALALAGKVRRVIGIESSPLAVSAAATNARQQGVAGAQFIRGDVTPSLLRRVAAREHPLVVLDPPRNGTAPGVIETVAALQPRRVVHCFCNIDLLPAEVQRWQQAGYTPREAVPVDMFPGTSAMEVVVAFERS
jgi:tRNA/tmRNA/rRNA uracil-C5-methylase (TrmA/RlmC/RlmD family)